ncbi:MAG: class F sortase, partial [Patescibacteria group bacterium]
YVEYGDGRTVGFVVRDVRTFGKDESTSSVFTSSDGKAHLNLITCVGPWNAMQQSYPSRLVVFGDMITD